MQAEAPGAEGAGGGSSIGEAELRGRNGRQWEGRLCSIPSQGMGYVSQYFM